MKHRIKFNFIKGEEGSRFFNDYSGNNSPYFHQTPTTNSLRVNSKKKNITMPYRGADLGQDFKGWFRREKRRLTNILKEKGCTNIKLDYGFYNFTGFFTSTSGQVYYISCSDVRHFPYNRLLIRTAESYKDFTGGANEYVGTKKEDLMNFKIQ